MENTGYVSLWLYGAFVVLAIIGSWVAIRHLRTENLDKDKYESIVGLFKWVIASVAISTVTLIVANLFKEREQDIKELEYFGKYTEDVKTLKLEERLKLTKFLSIVAPVGPLRNSWNAYYIEVQKEKEQLDTLEQIENKTEETQKKIEELRAPIIGGNKISDAEYYQNQGFNLLLEKSVDEAIKQFELSERTYPSYHQAYEIARYLRSKKSLLTNPNSSEWFKVYNNVADSLGYGMPPSIKEEFKSKGS